MLGFVIVGMLMWYRNTRP